MATNPKDSYEGILGALEDAMLDDACWPRASALIDEAFGAKGNILIFGGDNPDGDVDIFFTHCHYRGVDRAAWLQEYFRDYHEADDDRHQVRVRALPDSKIVHVTELFNERELKMSSYYNEALPRFQGQNGLCVRLDGPAGSRIAWAIADPVDARGWSRSRIEMIRRVLPHLRQYVRVRTALVDAGALGASVGELLDNARVGVVLLSRQQRILEANDRAAALLRRNDGLSDRNGALTAARADDNDRLRQLLALALPPFGGQGASGSMVLRRRNGHPRFALHIKPVQSWRVAALVLIADPMEPDGIEPDLVASALRLTPTETEIAILLTKGRTAPQIAAETGRGYGTVRSHLKHMFSKLGVSRQLDVVRLVLAVAGSGQRLSHLDN